MAAEFLRNTRYCLKALKLVGMDRSKGISLSYKIYGYTTRFIAFGLFLLLQLLYLPRIHSITEFADFLSIHMSCISVLSKSSIIMLKFSAFEKLLGSLKELVEYAAENQITFGDHIRKRMIKIRKLFIMYLVTVGISSVMGSLSGLLNAKEPPYQPQYKLFSPSFFDFEENYCYFVLTEFYLFVGPTFAGLTAVVVDFLPVFFYSMGAGLFEELADRINFIDTDFIVYKKPKSLTREYLQELMVQESNHNEKTTKELQKCIKIHIKIQEFLNEVQDLFSLIIFIQVLIGTTVICMTCYTITMFSPFNSAFWRQTSYIIPMGLQILIPCYFGNEIEIAAEKFSWGIFHSKWYFGNKNFRKALLLFLTQSSQSIVMVSGMIFEVTLENFVSVCQVAYNLYAIMQNMNN